MSISYTQTDVLCFLLYNVIPVHVQDFPLLWLDDIVDEQSNIVGFSMFNTTHPFYLEFIRSLNLSWREGCDINPYPGPAVRHTQTQYRSLLMYHTQTAHIKLCMCVFSCRRPCCLMRYTWWWVQCRNSTGVRRLVSNLSAAPPLRSGNTEPASWTTCVWSVCVCVCMHVCVHLFIQPLESLPALFSVLESIHCVI